MRLCECYIENFGVLKNFSCKFPDGLCTLVEKNGRGKTTLTVFIKAMFYGLEDTRKIKILENERKRYLPWNNGPCRGSLTIEVGDKKYRIERSFGQKSSDDTFAVYDLQKGSLSEDFTQRIGEELFGIDADGFERTLFLSENNFSGKNENKSIAAKLSDLTSSEADIGVLDNALELLDNERKFYHKKGGSGEISDIRANISNYNAKISEIQRKKDEHSLLLQKEAELNEKLSRLISQKRQADKENESISEREIKRNNEKIYREKLEVINIQKEKEKNLREFFKNHTPTDTEIENMAVVKAEYERLGRNLKNSIGFDTKKNGLDISKINTLKANAKNIEMMELAVKEKKSSASLQLERARNIFADEVPTEAEIAENIKNASGKGRKGGSFALLIIGILALISGAALYFVKPILSLLALISIPFFVAAFGAKKPSGSADFIAKFADKGGKRQSELQILFELKSKLEIYNSIIESANELEKEILRLEGQIQALSEEIEDFLNANNTTKSKSLWDRLAELELETVKKQAALGVYEKEYFDQKSRYEKLENELSAFISLFPVSSRENAISEIAGKLREYDTLRQNIMRDLSDLDYFAVSRGIDKSCVSVATYEQEIIKRIDTGAIFDSISSTEKELALLRRAIGEIEDDIDREEEYKSEIEQLKRSEANAIDMFETIEKTKKFLKLSGENLTTKYLAKTKAAFSEYVTLIAKENAGFEIDTTFSVKKNEGSLTKEADAYSKGTRDLYAIAIRFALVDALYEKEQPFIILDDPFAYFDDEKLARALSVIKAMSKKRQIIYLSCTKSRTV